MLAVSPKYDNLAALQAVPLFHGIDDARLARLARLASRCRMPRGATIVRAGEVADGLYVLLAGSVRVVSRNEDGREVILAVLGAGDFFGEMGVIDGRSGVADVVADAPCQLLVLAKADFRQCLEDDFTVALNVMNRLVLRLREANRKIESLALMDVHDRVAQLLFDCSEECGGVRAVRRRLSKQEIAKMVGASREMVCRVMKNLESDGYLRVEASRIVVAGT